MVWIRSAAGVSVYVEDAALHDVDLVLEVVED
jgi:hypothetical protein